MFAAVSPEIRENEKDYFGGYITRSVKLGRPPGKDAGNPQLKEELWITTIALLNEMGITLPPI